MADICGKCIHLNEKNKKKYSSKDEYYCAEICEYREPRDRACRHFVKRFGCHIVTEIIRSLPYSQVKDPEDHIVLKTFQDWRINTLEQDDKYSVLLEKYDDIGPKISEALSNDPIEPLMSISLMNMYLMPIIDMIRENQDDLAIAKYTEMVLHLKNKYAVEAKRPIYNNTIIDANKGMSRVLAKPEN